MKSCIGRRENSYSGMAVNNGEKVTELEKHYLATVPVIISLGKKHQWMLELVDKNVMRHRIFV